MKNGLLIWNVLLTVVAGYLLITHLGAKKGGASSVSKVTDKDTAGMAKDFRIAYFEMDSVETHFELVKEVTSDVNKKEEAMNSELDRLGREYQNKLVFYQNKQKEMTQPEYEAAAMDLKKFEQAITTRKQALEQEYVDFNTRSKKAIIAKIEEFIKQYNATRNYTYIIAEEPGLFYYKDTAYNITADVVKGLNAAHKTAKKK
jgi:outer membrane protein